MSDDSCINANADVPVLELEKVKLARTNQLQFLTSLRAASVWSHLLEATVEVVAGVIPRVARIVFLRRASDEVHQKMFQGDVPAHPPRSP